MNEWKKVKIGEFLTEREGRFKPDDKRISKYKRLDKIDFSGNIHLSNKPTKTDMILVQPGDLVISGINVAKGAITVYQGEEPVCATIHYSSYTFDSSKVDLDYFKFFVKSAAFIAAMQKQVKGGIKTEIKPKHLLALEISIPDLGTQKKIVKEISSQLEKTEQLSSEIEKQKSYAKQLHQNIFQEAIEGKLTADWRKQHPVQKGNPDYDAEALFEQIQKERKNEKKQKELSPITDEEKPFEIPEGWKWVRLGSIIQYLSDFNSNGGYALLDSNVKMYGTKDYAIMIRTTDFENGFDLAKVKYINEKAYNLLEKSKLFGNEIIMNKIGSAGKTFIMPKLNYPASLGRNAFLIRLTTRCEVKFIYDVLNSDFGKNDIQQYVKGALTKTITKDNVRRLLIPFPPLSEQKEIVTRVEKYLQTITQLETQIATRETTTKQLMQSILKDAFEED